MRAPRHSLFAAVAGVGVLLAGAVGFTPASPSQPTAAPRLTTASAVQAVSAVQELGALRSELQRIVQQSSARWSILAYSADGRDTLFARDPDLALAPASNVKVLTTAAALHHLGPDYRYLTFLAADGPVRDGVLHGDLILYGTGDPSLSDRLLPSRTAALEGLVRTLGERGIRRVTGDVVGDGSLFPGPLLADGWDERDLNDWFAAPVSALSFNENVVTLRVAAAELAGAPTVHMIPKGADLPIQNGATTVPGRRRVRLELGRDRPLGPIQVSGEIQRGSRDVWRQMTVSSPPRFAASVLRLVLEEAGIEVDGETRAIRDASDSRITHHRISAPALADSAGLRVLAVHRSPPLGEILDVVNKKSHNLFAELVLRTVGHVVEGDGSFRGGAGAVERFLVEEAGVEPSAVELHDGSGLSSLNRVSAGAFVRLLAYMVGSERWDAFWASLPEAGNPQELRRMYQTAAAGNLRAKTGTIENSSALTGVVRTANGERILFSIIANDVPSRWGAKRIEDGIGVRLATFERPFEAREAPTRLAASAAGEEAADTVGGRVAAASPEESDTAPGSRAAAEPEASAAADEERWHTISRGENLTVVAREYGLRVNAIVDANPDLSPNRLQPGQRIRIPTGSAEASDAPDPATTRDPEEHRVESGESFWTIARKYGVSVNELMDANPRVTPQGLQPGQVLTVPEGSGGGEGR